MQDRQAASSIELQARAISFIQSKSVGSRPGRSYDITVNFHPDRRTIDGTPILSALAKDHKLKSQFETKTSNGGLSAYPGGERWMWEHKAFGGVYDDAPAHQRPKYGALNFRENAVGASPRFGSAYFRLKPHILDRATFCYPDSYFKPSDFSTYGHVSSLIELANGGKFDVLDSHIEAHMHGDVDIANDVHSLVLDPIYKGTIVEAQANALPCIIEWHPGFQLDIRVVEENPEYRGTKYVELAKSLANNGLLNPLILGAAIESGGYDPQDIKKVWHYLAKFGCEYNYYVIHY